QQPPPLNPQPTPPKQGGGACAPCACVARVRKSPRFCPLACPQSAPTPQGYPPPSLPALERV
ncbi:hypothetical protein, partial [Helicobacter felis]|uniref:hypothetical protein n=1 Tax=Helicobacter felis TaxID=214 RepID=UPI001F17F4F6